MHHCTDRRLPVDLGNIAMDLAINCLIPKGDKNVRLLDPPTNDKGDIAEPSLRNSRRSQCLLILKRTRRTEWYYDYLSKKKVTMKMLGLGDGEGKTGSFDEHEGFGKSELADELVRQKVDEINRETHGVTSTLRKRL